jgi:serine/threonine protein kinase/Tfp pilus assembly protein PilF
MALPPGSRLDRYEVLSLLGEGGMGEVYLAQDSRLRRKVAIKLLPAEFTRDADRVHRFQQEAYAASALNHPNIITIYEIGEVDGTWFIATEYIEGRTLRQQMNSGRLALADKLEAAAQIASALAAAHAAGIVHRDIKPENVIVRPDGLVKVLDFGLAKLSEDPFSRTTLGNTTETGVVMGTVRYMSPEQARGQKVDARTDIFSLGVVLYEMLAGKSPFSGVTTADLIAALLGEEPLPISRYVPEAPEGLERLVTRSLRKDRDERYSSAQAMFSELKELKRSSETEPELESGRVFGNKRHKKAVLPALAAVLIAALSILYFTPRGSAIDSIAVLPFINMSEDPTTEYLSDGISDSVINRLSPYLRVISLNSVLRYKGKQIDAQSVGQELKVRAVLIGRMTQRGDELSFSAELVDVHDNRRLWGEQYPNRQLADLINLQEEIAQEISEKLRLRLSGEDQQRLARRETEDSEAYRLYLQGRFYWNKFTADGFNKSIEYFEGAIKKDPNYSLAYSGLADSYSLLGEIGAVLPREAFPQARDYAVKALALDEKLAQAHLSLGIVKLFYDWDLAEAEKGLRRAKELAPNDPQVYHFYGHYLQWAEQLDAGRKEIKRGLDLDPTNLVINAEYGMADYYLRRHDVAIGQLQKTLELDSSFVLASVWLAYSYEQQGKYGEALAELEKARKIDPIWSAIPAEIALVTASQGKKAEARKMISELSERRRREYIDPTSIALIYVALDDKDQAFAWLEKAYQERAGTLPWMKIDPMFDPLRKDGRFDNLQRRVFK